ncbi:MAG: zinc ribbon domain-containing protein [Chloroflexota bacterium]
MSSDDGLCPRCGAALGPNGRFCEQCGARLDHEPASVGEAAAEGAPTTPMALASGTAGGDDVTWSRRVPLLTNRFILWDFAWVFGVSVGALYLIVAVMGLFAEGELVLLPPEVGLIVLAILGGLFLVATLLVLGNGYNMVFTLDGEGVTWRSGRRERNLGRLAWFVGLLALLQGRPGLLGAATLAQSQEGDGIAWRSLHAVKVYPGPRVISLSNSWRAVLRLYCLPENFEAVKERVLAEAAAAERWRAAHPRPASRYAWRPRLLWFLLVTAAALASTAWDGEEVAGFALVAWAFVSLAVLVEGGLRRLLAAVGLGATLLLGAVLWSLGAAPYVWARGLIAGYGYEYQTELLIVSAVGTVVLLLVGAQRLLFARHMIATRERTAQEG